ncbi:hypothetical protein DOY81_003953, partial [Sarcophaga bullata]
MKLPQFLTLQNAVSFSKQNENKNEYKISSSNNDFPNYNTKYS